MLLSAKNSHKKLNQTAKMSSYHKTASTNSSPVQPAGRTKISKATVSVKQESRLPTSTQPHATPFTMSKDPVPPPISSQCAENVITQEEQHPTISAPHSVAQEGNMQVYRSPTEHHHNDIISLGRSFG